MHMKKSNKQILVDKANAELNRIGARTDGIDSFDICLDRHERISAADNSGYYRCNNYRSLLSDLREFADNCITDPDYDGDNHDIWMAIWSLFDVR
jgi:hypothetical protein